MGKGCCAQVRIWLIAVMGVLCGMKGLSAESPEIIYLTWIHDPSTTMVVQWHSDQEQRDSVVSFREEVPGGGWQQVRGIYTQLPKTEQLVHTVELTDLKPDTKYRFYVEGTTGVYLFQTLPKQLDRPVKFVVGGDAYLYEKLFKKMNRQVAAQNPDFVVVGGDIAYTYGRAGIFQGPSRQITRWQTFLKSWKKMVTEDGRMIPLFAVVGNHDVRASGLNPQSYRTLFYELFALPEKGTPFRVLDCGNYLSLVMLDTGHSFRIDGQQTRWLNKALSEREQMHYKFAAYHVGAYPAVYPFDGGTPRQIRKQWCPLFEQYQLHAAFEHHNHAYKRTCPIKQGAADPHGVVYMGDGSWGVSPRRVKNAEAWYLSKGEKVNAVCVVTLESEVGKVEALTNGGEIIDEVIFLPSHRQPVANALRELVRSPATQGRDLSAQ